MVGDLSFGNLLGPFSKMRPLAKAVSQQKALQRLDFVFLFFVPRFDHSSVGRSANDCCSRSRVGHRHHWTHLRIKLIEK